MARKHLLMNAIISFSAPENIIQVGRKDMN